MISSHRYQRALEFATRKHEGQYRIGGLAYITHPVAVAQMLREQGYATEYQIAGLFHDLLEDTDATEAELEELGGPAVLEAVRLLTKRPGYVMEDYVQRIRVNPMAFAVKTADRLHNLRCATATDEAFRRRYVRETAEWYMDFSSEIRQAARELAASLREPLAEYPCLYDTQGEA